MAPGTATSGTLGATLKRGQMSLLRRFLQIAQHRDNVRAQG
jgi:hypothetical protein